MKMLKIYAIAQRSRGLARARCGGRLQQCENVNDPFDAHLHSIDPKPLLPSFPALF
jgi:hypothetical protein